MSDSRMAAKPKLATCCDVLAAALRRAGAGALAAAALLLALPAQAELWGFVDQDGVAHFASEQLDERYELFAKEPARAGVVAGPGVTAAMPPSKAVGDLAGAGREGIRPEATAPALKHPKLVLIERLPGYKANRQHLQAAAKRHGVDYALLKAVAAAESGFNPKAVSPKGAIGLMQVMPATAERYGVASDKTRSVEEKLADPQINARTGARYLAYLLKLFPERLDLAVAAYNAGEGAVQRYKRQIPPFRETQNYVKTVMQLYAAFQPDAASKPVGDSEQPVMRRQGQRVHAEFKSNS